MNYAELHCASAFSFLEGASLPEDLVARAAALELPAVALVDRNTLSGAPRFYKAAKEAGIKALVGAEIVLDDSSGRRSEATESASPRLSGPLGLVPDPPPPGTPPSHASPDPTRTAIGASSPLYVQRRDPGAPLRSYLLVVCTRNHALRPSTLGR